MRFITLITYFYFIKQLIPVCLSKFVDVLVGDQLEIKCLGGVSKRQASTPIQRIRFKGYAESIKHQEKFYSIEDVAVKFPSGITLKKEGNVLVLDIERVNVLHSGVYQCRIGTITNGDVKEEIKEENYIAVHDVGKMEYLFKALGQLEGKYNVDVRDSFSVEFRTSTYGECDGCNGKGEKRAFAFCYGKQQASGKTNEWQCSDPNMVFTLRGLVATRPEQIIVETCSESCTGKNDSLEASGKPILRKMILGEPLILTCPSGNESARNPIRWESDGRPLLRSEFGLKRKHLATIFVENDNRLYLKDITTISNTTLKFSCIFNSMIRHDFEVQTVELENVTSVHYINHFYWTGITIGIQISVFFVTFALWIFYESIRSSYCIYNCCSKKKSKKSTFEPDNIDAEEYQESETERRV